MKIEDTSVVGTPKIISTPPKPKKTKKEHKNNLCSFYLEFEFYSLRHIT